MTNTMMGELFFAATVEAAGIPAGHGSVSALAARLDIQRATVSRWKSGKQDPSPEHMAKAASVLGLWFCLTLEPDGTWTIWFQDGA